MGLNYSSILEEGHFTVEKEKHGRCTGCKDCKTVHCNDGYGFYGCFHKPYHGKMVAEIKDCPKELIIHDL